jgi:hypothetical protein
MRKRASYLLTLPNYLLRILFSSVVIIILLITSSSLLLSSSFTFVTSSFLSSSIPVRKEGERMTQRKEGER